MGGEANIPVPLRMRAAHIQSLNSCRIPVRQLLDGQEVTICDGFYPKYEAGGEEGPTSELLGL